MSIRGMHPLRGEIRWVRLDPIVGSEIAKTRPCIVVTNDLLNERRKTSCPFHLVRGRLRIWESLSTAARYRVSP